MFILFITNTKNNKQYVGITTKKIKIRFAEHCYAARNGSTTKLHQAITMYGEECFSIKRIAKTYSRKSLASLEKQFIKYYESVETGYNTFPGSNWAPSHLGKPTKYKGKIFESQAALARYLGACRSSVRNHIVLGKPKKDKYEVTIDGIKFNSLSAVSRHLSIPISTVHYRYKNGLSLG